jgi:putative hydrolase of the HAD superfamily
MDAILFDLDNTLYPPERNVFSLIDRRINRFMNEVVGIPETEVDGLRRRYWAEYGVTLQGLIRHYGVDAEAYLEYVHDVDVAGCLEPDDELRRALEGLPLRRAVFTNGSRGHAERVLETLAVADLFEVIFDISIASYRPKPFPEPYFKALERLGVSPARCLMVEDSVDNLKTAKDLGMGTILVGRTESLPFIDCCVETAAQVPQVLSRWVG